MNTQNLPLLEAANNLQPVINEKSMLSPLVVDGEALSAKNLFYYESENIASPSSDIISLYEVKEGDTIGEIADMFGVSVNTIRWANNMNSKTSLKTGQELVILPISGVKYTIKKGDTIQGIASNFKGDQSDIMAYNSITPDTLKIGDEIIIPNGELTSSVKVVSKSGAAAKTATKKSGSGYFVRPISGGIKTQGIHGHNGVDLASKLGTPVMAAASGKVIIAKQGGWNGGYGSYVVISHANGIQTLYGHLNSVNVSVGENVTQGEVIGGMGNTGKSTGVHLHFEVRGGVNPF